MEEVRKLAAEFKRRSALYGPLAFYDAVVSEVDSEAYTCTVELDDLPIYDVRLRAVVSDKQSIDILPKAGSQVVIGKLADDDFIVIACDEIDSYRVSVAETVFEIDSTGTLIQREQDTLNKVLTDLIKAVLSVMAPKDVPGLTDLLTRVNKLLK